MGIPLKEPIAPRYLYINPTTNRVHLLVPLVCGEEISTDNTCRATAALDDFFMSRARQELAHYKEALVFDIGLFAEERPQRIAKEERLAQIMTYIDAIEAMRGSYKETVHEFLSTPSNLYSIQLRPRLQDFASNVVNPVFTIKRENDANGLPQSALYNAMYHGFSCIDIKAKDPRTQFMHAVSMSVTDSTSFEDIQRILSERMVAMFGLRIDFTQCTGGKLASKEVIDNLMGFEDDATSEDYIHGLTGACAPDVWKTLPTPPFYSLPTQSSVEELTEALSMLTQFFLANVNVYCKAKGISHKNFGLILDESPVLSEALVETICATLMSSHDVETAICDFFNNHKEVFWLAYILTEDHRMAIRQQFERTYRTITATKENPHMDDFLLLDREATGEQSKAVIHQGSICVNFAEISSPFASSNPDYFNQIRADFSGHPTRIPHRNESIPNEIEIGADTPITQRLLNYTSELLYKACQKGDLDQLKSLLMVDKIIHLSRSVTTGKMPLHIAAEEGHCHIAKLLLENGALVNQTINEGVTPLLLATQNGHEDMVQLLIESGACVNQGAKNTATPLFIAAQNGCQGIAALLIKKGAFVNQPMQNEVTPLLIAVQNGHRGSAELFLKNNAFINQARHDGVAPLLFAASHGDIAMVKLLLEHEASVNQANKNGVTPLMVAAQKGYGDVVKVLLDEGAFVDQTSKDGVTSLLIAAQNGHRDTVESLLEKGAFVNQVLEDGTTPLLIAVQNGHQETVKLLLDKGACVNQARNEGATPLFIAAQKGDYSIVKILLPAGAEPNNASLSDKRTLLALVKKSSRDVQERMALWLQQKKNKTLYMQPHEVSLSLKAQERLGLPTLQNMQSYSIALSLEVQERLDLLLPHKKKQMIYIQPHEIALIMGHREIARFIKQFSSKSCAFVNNMYLFYNELGEKVSLPAAREIADRFGSVDLN